MLHDIQRRVQSADSLLCPTPPMSTLIEILPSEVEAHARKLLAALHGRSALKPLAARS